MKTKKEATEILNILRNHYPEATCSLDFKSPFQMVIAVMLSAQCTDERVNKTTPLLFKDYGTPEKMAKMDIKELENIIHPCGFYKNKAKNALACSQVLVEKYNSIVPNNMEDLMSLPGVGRKSANVIMLEAFGDAQGIAVDTHARRISNKIGFSSKAEPEKIEQDLLKQFPKEDWKDVNHLFVWHGRYTCIARNPKCDKCPLQKHCNDYKARTK
ncbi:MAG: endonuclease III [Coprobacillus sp.]|jgi:endonuclease-3|nr:endonuclease III [Coprobacillus sp.]